MEAKRKVGRPRLGAEVQSSTERVRASRKRRLNAGGKRVEVVLCREALTALMKLMAAHKKTAKVVIETALLSSNSEGDLP